MLWLMKTAKNKLTRPKKSSKYERIYDHSANLFINHSFIRQMAEDMYFNGLGNNFRDSNELGNSRVCTEPSTSFIPSHVPINFTPCIPSKNMSKKWSPKQ
mmetsp:Transcript_19038/g.27962  ORF Transcript_19038/g.27962 Transcript_19038/m.27962 type:complete len:100 (+) Transcript_19038:1019-1318(+)